jgi:hypothetical protein
MVGFLTLDQLVKVMKKQQPVAVPLSYRSLRHLLPIVAFQQA